MKKLPIPFKVQGNMSVCSPKTPASDCSRFNNIPLTRTHSEPDSIHLIVNFATANNTEGNILVHMYSPLHHTPSFHPKDIISFPLPQQYGIFSIHTNSRNFSAFSAAKQSTLLQLPRLVPSNVAAPYSSPVLPFPPKPGGGLLPFWILNPKTPQSRSLSS